MEVSGWGETPDEVLWDLPVAARNLAIGLGERITRRHAVD
jgi:hypothetical protein